MACAAGRRLPAFAEASALCVGDMGRSGRAHLMTAGTARAWWAMKQAAAGDGVALIPISAFRTVDRQARLVERAVRRGEPRAQVLRRLAPPGHSEHHTGRAIDIGTPGCPPADAAFADTAAYRWLQVHAARFGFRESYPPGNASGFIAEPWHWCHAGA